MFNNIMSIFYTCVDSAYDWFVSLVNSVPGVFGLMLGVFGIWATIRFILSPLSGGRLPFGGSDTVKRRKDGDSQ